jgi:hypothetical protein
VTHEYIAFDSRALMFAACICENVDEKCDLVTSGVFKMSHSAVRIEEITSLDHSQGKNGVQLSVSASFAPLAARWL